MHSKGEAGKRQWHTDSVALWCPGGCLDTQTFLPKIAEYLKKAMGTYTDKNGKKQDRFQLVLNKNVTCVFYDATASNEATITDLTFSDGTEVKIHRSSLYIFAPGESVGTLKNMGFSEPTYASFAGASLYLNIPATQKQLEALNINST